MIHGPVIKLTVLPRAGAIVVPITTVLTLIIIRGARFLVKVGLRKAARKMTVIIFLLVPIVITHLVAFTTSIDIAAMFTGVIGMRAFYVRLDMLVVGEWELADS